MKEKWFEKEGKIVSKWIADGEKVAFWGASISGLQIIDRILGMYKERLLGQSKGITPEIVYDNKKAGSIVEVCDYLFPVKKFDDSKEYKIILCVVNKEANLEISNILENSGYERNKDYVDAYRLSSVAIGTEEDPYEEAHPVADYAPWRKDKDFIKIYEKAKNNTMCDVYRCYSLWSLVQQTGKCKTGDIVEIGVWRGGTGTIMASAARKANITLNTYLCDTFEGVVKVGERDGYYKGGEYANTSVQIVQSLMDELGIERVKIEKGIFPEDVQDKFEKLSFRFAHIDVDVYNSGKDIFNFVWNRLVLGGWSFLMIMALNAQMELRDW